LGVLLIRRRQSFLAGADFDHNEVRENFENFIKDLVEGQGEDRESAARTHPFELMRAVMTATIDELMPLLRPIHEFDAIVARAGFEDALKMTLVKAFHRALLKVLTISTCLDLPSVLTPQNPGNWFYTAGRICTRPGFPNHTTRVLYSGPR
jgi:hypothetical protein